MEKKQIAAEKKDETAITIEPNKKTIAPLLTYSAIIGAVLHYVGYTYLKSFLSGAGFYRSYVDISIQEALYQGNEAITFFLAKMIENIDFLTFAMMPLTSSVSFATTLTVVYAIYLCAQNSRFERWVGSARSIVVQKMQRFITPKSIATKGLNSFWIYVTSFVGFYVFFAVAIFILFVLAVMLWWIINLSQFIGFKAGEEKAFKHECKMVALDEIPENTKNGMGCQHLLLNKPFRGSDVLVGQRIFTSKDTIFFLTIDGAYEVSSQQEVRLFTSKYDIERMRSEAKEKNTPPQL